MKLISILLLVTIVSMGAVSSNANASTQSKKVAPALAIPAALATISVLEAAVYCALAAGVITLAQSDEFNRELAGARESIQKMTKEAWEKSRDGFIRLFDQIKHAIENHRGIDVYSPTCPKPGVVPIVQGQTVPQTKTRVHTEDCNDPEVCCKDFLNKFKTETTKQKWNKQWVQQTWKKIFKGYDGRGKVPKTADCCLEWDRKHWGWEVYDKSGRHMGERSCSDLSDDICKTSDPAIYGGHSQADNSGKHSPRNCFK